MNAINYPSTAHTAPACSFTEAVLRGLATDGGLFVPSHLPPLQADTFKQLMQADSCHLPGIALLEPFVLPFSERELKNILQTALNFPIPLISLKDNIFLLEVFHGPTLAFKDVGARFMAGILTEIVKKTGTQLDILVATSGDTGSAVAHAFYKKKGVRVCVLYPAGRITPLQEKQMTGLGGNILAVKIQGTFDDCQHLVKTFLADRSLALPGRQYSTANSINIARLLPQMIYHSWGIIQLKQGGKYLRAAPLMSIPSGNLGNLVSALYAHARGLPVEHFIAATNANAVFPDFLTQGKYAAQPSCQTVSSAMDVGNPSNLARLQHFFQDDLTRMRQAISAISVSDAETLDTLRRVWETEKYLPDPHTAVGIAAAWRFREQHPEYRHHPVIVTATAHPAKFPAVIQQAIGTDSVIQVPDSLQHLRETAARFTELPPDPTALHNLLQSFRGED